MALTDNDFRDNDVWNNDPEIRELNPPAGGMRSYHAYAVDAGAGPDGKHIGNCFMMNVDGESGELAVVIGDKRYWGKGYGTETVVALVGHWLSHGLRRIWLKVLPWNARAIRCYHKCGFAPAGRLVLDGIEFLLMETRSQ